MKDQELNFEGVEQQQFDARFAAALTRIRRLPVAQVGNVQIWELDTPIDTPR